MKKYICYVTTYYPSFVVEAETEDDAWFEAQSADWNREEAETEITVEVMDDEN